MLDSPLGDLESTAEEVKFTPVRYTNWASIIGGLVTRRRTTENRMTRIYKNYRGNQQILGDEDEIIVNVTFGDTRVLESMLYFTDPYIRVRPSTNPSIAPKAQLLEGILNSIWYTERIGRQIRRCIVDACLVGISWMQVGFSDYHDPNMLYRGGKVFAKRRCPIDLYTEDDISNFDEATFYARRGLYSTRWLKRLFKREWKADTDTNVFQRRGVSGRKSTQAMLYEVEDLVEKRLFIMSPQHKAIIHETALPYDYFEGSMYVPLAFVDDPEQLNPISMTEIISGQQDELNRIRTQQMRHRKRYNRRYLMERGAMKDEEIAKVEAGEDGVIAKTEGSPKGVVVPIEDAPLDLGGTRDYQLDIKSDRREILGINEYLRAGAVPRTKTAQEASMIQQGSNIRSQNLACYLHEFVVDIARRLSLIVQHEYDDINYLPKQEGEVVSWTKEDIAGDFEVEIELGSTLPPQPIPYETLLNQGKTPPGQGGMPGGMLGAEGAMPPEGMG